MSVDIRRDELDVARPQSRHRVLLRRGSGGLRHQHKILGEIPTRLDATGYIESPYQPRQLYVRALDLITGKLHWEFKQVGSRAYGAGLLSTAGGLIFAGCDQGIFTALDAKNGTALWHFNVGQPISASPITYSFKGRQYVAVEAGSDVVAFGLFGDDWQSKSVK